MCCKLPLKPTEEDQEERRGATVSPAAAKEVSMDAPVVAVFFRTGRPALMVFHRSGPALAEFN